MNKILSILIVCLICFSSLAFFNPLIVKATTIYMSDDFENFTTGWTMTTSGGGTFIKSSTQKHGGSYSAFCSSTASGSSAAAVNSTSGSWGGTHHASLWIYIDSSYTGALHCVLIEMYDGSSKLAEIIALTNYGTTFYLQNWAGSVLGYQNITTITPDTWHNIEDYYNATTFLHRIYLNDIKQGTDWLSYSNASTLKTIYLGDVSNSGTECNGKLYYDDWLVDDYMTEPSPSVDTEAPKYSNIGTNTTLATQPCQFSVLWTDNVSLSGYIFGTNNTGSFVNETWVAFGSSNNSWANATKTLSSTIGIKVSFQWWANDTSNNWNNTGTQTLTTIGCNITFYWTYSGFYLVGKFYYNSTLISVNGTTASFLYGTILYLQAFPSLYSTYATSFDWFIVNGSAWGIAGVFNPISFVVDANYDISASFVEGKLVMSRFSVSSPNALINETVTFDPGTSWSFTIPTYLEWDFGDGNVTGVGSNSTITHKYAATGLYNVTFTVYLDFGVHEHWTFYSVKISEDTSWYIAPGFILGLVCFMAVGLVFVKKRRD